MQHAAAPAARAGAGVRMVRRLPPLLPPPGITAVAAAAVVAAAVGSLGVHSALRN